VVLAEKIGIKIFRTEVDFSAHFNETYMLAQQYGIVLVAQLDYSTLAYNNTFTLKDWKLVVTKAQAQYPLVHIWEIWNEPTLSKYQFGYMDGTPQHYVDLLKSAYTILKSKDPSSTILGLGGAQLQVPTDITFAQNVFSLGAGQYMDAISIHAYPDELNLGQTWKYYQQSWTSALQQYKKLTGGKPFWVTETGLQSNQKTDSDQAAYLKNAYLFFQAQGAAAFIWFNIVDYIGGALEPSGLNAWGLLTVNLDIKPSYTTYGSLLS
jgi:hypothetical protein